MMTLKYFLMKMPKAYGKYMPNTKPDYNYSVKDFLLYMSRKNREITPHIYNEVFKTMTASVEEILSKGDSITIPGFVRIAPVVRGVFDSDDEPFNRSKHSIGVKCTVLPDLVRKVGDKVKVKRIKTLDRYPSISGIRDFKAKSNVVNRHSANRINGIYLNLKRFEFTGFMLSSRTLPYREIMVNKEEIEIIKHTSLQMIYIFNRKFVPPDWLADGAEISLKLRYKTKNGATDNYGYFSTTWAS